jgi:predicted PurR-regulated permease PerM
VRDRLGETEAQASWLRAFLLRHRSSIEGSLAQIEKSASKAVAGLLVIPILAIFFLSDGENLANQLIRLFSTKDNIAALQSLTQELHHTLQRYIRAKVSLAGLSLLFCSTAMLILGFPSAIALGVLAGILEFIPVAGWMMTAAIIVSTGALAHAHWIWMLGLLGVWRVLMDYAISPRVMGRELEMHPLLAIFTVMVGGAIGGIIGIYLSVPLVAVLGVVYRRFGPHPTTEALSEAKVSA